MNFVDQTEAGELSDAFWDSVLPMRLNTSVASSPYSNAFLMAQCKAHDRGFLSDQIRVEDMLDQRADIHHLIPKAYLIRNHIDSRGQYNQIANYVLLQSEINTKIMDVAPKAYMAGIWDAIREEKPGISGIIDEKDLRHNLEEACIPEGFSDMTFEDYDRFWMPGELWRRFSRLACGLFICNDRYGGLCGNELEAAMKLS